MCSELSPRVNQSSPECGPAAFEREGGKGDGERRSQKKTERNFMSPRWCCGCRGCLYVGRSRVQVPSGGSPLRLRKKDGCSGRKCIHLQARRAAFPAQLCSPSKQLWEKRLRRLRTKEIHEFSLGHHLSPATVLRSLESAFPWLAVESQPALPLIPSRSE